MEHKTPITEAQKKIMQRKEVAYLPPAVKEKLNTYCALRNESKSQFITDAVRDRLRQLNQL